MKKKALIFLLALLATLLFLALAGRLLVTDRPEKSDVIVVLDGDSLDQRYRRGMELLRAGYGRHLFLDASADSSFYGHTPASYAEAFLKEDAKDMASYVSVCPFSENSTITEAYYVGRCLAPLAAKHALLVTSDWHTARALSIFRHKLPQYRWSIAAAHDERLFQTKWWSRREWAKTTFQEWLKVIWWNAVDRWRG